MSGPRDLILAAAATGSFLLCLSVASRCRPSPAPRWAAETAAQAATGGDGGVTPAYQRLWSTPQDYLADYGFENFNRDRLSVHYQVPRWALGPYEAQFGYRPAEAAAISDSARAAAYFESRGFRVLRPGVVAVDMPQLVRKNAALVRPVAAALDRTARLRSYGSDDVIGAAASLVQTAIRYQVPALEVDGRDTAGVLQPVSVLVRGFGDCDTKTGLLASLLANWPRMRMLGVALPGHYLMGVLRLPGQGDAYVEYDGLDYDLVEAAGPAWLPIGMVSEHTMALLEAADGYRIDPFF